MLKSKSYRCQINGDQHKNNERNMQLASEWPERKSIIKTNINETRKPVSLVRIKYHLQSAEIITKCPQTNHACLK